MDRFGSVKTNSLRQKVSSTCCSFVVIGTCSSRSCGWQWCSVQICACSFGFEFYSSSMYQALPCRRRSCSYVLSGVVEVELSVVMCGWGWRTRWSAPPLDLCMLRQESHFLPLQITLICCELKCSFFTVCYSVRKLRMLNVVTILLNELQRHMMPTYLENNEKFYGIYCDKNVRLSSILSLGHSCMTFFVQK